MERKIENLSKGDILEPDFIHGLKGVMPTVTDTKHCLQLGEAADYAYTPGCRLKPLYHTFAEFKGEWRYYGCCFKNETIDKKWR